MAARISTRISIKWAAEPASEPTDTLVLSLGGYYVDLRIAKVDNSIDWALAGQRIVISEQPRKYRVMAASSSQLSLVLTLLDRRSGEVYIFNQFPG